MSDQELDATLSKLMTEAEGAAEPDPVEAAAEEPATDGDEPAADEGGEDAPEPSSEGEKPGDKPAGDKPEEKPEEKAKPESPEDAEITKLLEEHGIKAPAKGQRDNRIPYARVRRITGNFIKRFKGSHESELRTRDDAIRQRDAQIEKFTKVEQLIESDPDRYIGMLATMLPEKYGRFVGKGGEAGAAGSAASVPVGADKPKPDLTFEDGTVGYSPEQHDKLLQWAVQKGAEEGRKAALAEVDKKYGSVYNKITTEERMAALLPKMRVEVERLRGIYGDVFTEDEAKAGANGEPGESKVLQYLREHSDWDPKVQRWIPRISFESAVHAVMVPLLKERQAAELNNARKNWAKEQNSRRPAASGSGPAGSKPADRTSREGMSEDDRITAAIMDSIRAAGISQ